MARPKAFDFERQHEPKVSRLSTSRLGSYSESQNDESQVNSAVDSVPDSPYYDPEEDETQDKGLDKPQEKERDNFVLENPFDSDSSRILFDAIDRLQSCGVSQELAIPQVIP